MSSRTIGDQQVVAAEAALIPAPRVATSPRAEASAVAPVAAGVERDRRPAPRRIIGVCAWAAALGVAGLVLGVVALVTIIGGKAPHWYEPTLIGIGLGGVAFTVVAFLTIQHRIVPWLFLTLSSGGVLAGFIVAGAA